MAPSLADGPHNVPVMGERGRHRPSHVGEATKLADVAARMAAVGIAPQGRGLYFGSLPTSKREAGLVGKRRGQEAAALDAAGTALGSVGMLAFAAVVWWIVERRRRPRREAKRF